MAKKTIFKNEIPGGCGGGTVVYVSLKEIFVFLQTSLCDTGIEGEAQIHRKDRGKGRGRNACDSGISQSWSHPPPKRSKQ